jgi:hypothetical protein
MRGKLLQQFKVGKAQANRLNPTKNLMLTRSENLFAFIEDQLARTNQLHSMLCRRQVGCILHFHNQ